MIKEYLKSVYEDLKARRRGERRIAPRGTTGRVYARPEDTAAVPLLVKKEPIATLTMRVTRVDGTVETIKVPAQVVENLNG